MSRPAAHVRPHRFSQHAGPSGVLSGPARPRGGADFPRGHLRFQERHSFHLEDEGRPAGGNAHGVGSATPESKFYGHSVVAGGHVHKDGHIRTGSSSLHQRPSRNLIKALPELLGLGRLARSIVRRSAGEARD